MENRFEFYFDSVMTAVEYNLTFEKFVKYFESTIEHYNTDDCYVDKNGNIHYHTYKDEDGTIITMDHFKPEFYLYDKSLIRVITLSITGYDDQKQFNIELISTSINQFIDFQSNETRVKELKKYSTYKFKTHDKNLVQYCYKLIFDSADNNELKQVWDSWNS